MFPVLGSYIKIAKRQLKLCLTGQVLHSKPPRNVVSPVYAFQLHNLSRINNNHLCPCPRGAEPLYWHHQISLSSLQAIWELMSKELEWSNLPEALSQAASLLFICLSLVVFGQLHLFLWVCYLLNMKKSMRIVSLGELNSIEIKALCFDWTVPSLI